MDHSYVDIEKAKQDNMIKGSRNYFGFYVHQKMPYPGDMTSDWMTLSSAYIISSANDMGKYLQWYISDSHPEILSKENRQRMFSETVNAADNYKYGFGWGVVSSEGRELYLHGGNVENYTTYMIIVPEKKIGIIALTNSCDFFVADGYTVSIPMNTAYEIINWDTNDISENDYMYKHLMYDLIKLILTAACSLPVWRYKKWRNKNNNKILSGIFIAVIHIIVPTLLLTVFSITMDRPLFVVRRFAPDVFITQCICTVCLYGTGLLKIINLIKKNKELKAK